MDRYEEALERFAERPDCDLIFASAMPERLRQEDCVLGIDEAGRGPVLGPMVYGACLVPAASEGRLKEAGHADSKGLSEEVRDKLFARLHEEDREEVAYFAHIISPNVICNNMLDRAKTNLNTLSHNAAIGLIRRALEAGANVTRVVLDTVGPADKYQAKLAALFPQLLVVVESKADANHPVVSAASVVAKVTRDACLRRWRFLERLEGPDGAEASREFGCGYPSDPVTKQFLLRVCDRVFGFPQLVRTSWSTAGALMESRCLPVQWEDLEEEVKPARGKRRSAAETGQGQSLLNFFAPTPAKGRKRRHRFFRDRKLERVVGALV